MQYKRITNGFWKGFIGSAVVLLILALMIQTTMSQENSTSNLEANQSQSDDSGGEPTLTTDDPLGRVFIPLDQPLEQDIEQSNLQQVVETNAAPTMSEEEIIAASNQAMAEEALLNQTASGYTSPLVIPAADFRSDGTMPDSYWFSFAGGYVEGDANNYGCMVAPAYLPGGATLISLWASIRDNDGVYDVYIKLWRVDNYSGAANEMASTSTSGASSTLQTVSDLTVNYPDIVYPSYSYYVTTCLSSADVELYSVRLYYQ